jgi:transposase
MPSRASCTEGGSWENIAKLSWLSTSPRRSHAIAIAEGGRTGEVRFLGDVENSLLPIERTIKRLAGRFDRLHVCFEAGPTGYGLYRQIQALGHDCMVVAPALIPKRSGERIKTNRRDAVTLARLHRAGELTGVWTADAPHEAVRDLVRAREAAADDLRRKRQQLLSYPRRCPSRAIRGLRRRFGGGQIQARQSIPEGRSHRRHVWRRS